MLYPRDGKFHVSLSIPGQESIICKNIGITASANFLIPTIEYIVQCATVGDLGIADSIKRNKAVQNLNKCKSEETLKILAKNLKVSIDGDPKKYKTTTGYLIPASKVSLVGVSNPPSLGTASIPSIPTDAFDGLKTIERTAVQAALEQYKPFIEIAKLVVQHLAQIEDIIARIMAVGGPSEKPAGNAGDGKRLVNGGRPKALGFGGASDMKKSIGKIDSLNKKMAAKKSKKESDNASSSTKGVKDNTSKKDFGNYQVISIDYSTGVFKEGVDYEYTYIDLEPDDVTLESDYDGIDLNDNDPYKDMKPKSIIFGIYDSKGNDMSPDSDLLTYTIGPNGDVIKGPAVDIGGEPGIQGIKKADWLIRTGRWKGNFPRKGLVYRWRKNGDIKNSATDPSTDDDKNWDQLFYIDKDRNIGTDKIDSKGNPNQPVLYFTDDEKGVFRQMMRDIIDLKFAKQVPTITSPYPLTPVTPLTGIEKIFYKNKIMEQVEPNLQAQLEGIDNYGFLKSVQKYGLLDEGNPVSLPPNLINSYLPKKIPVGIGNNQTEDIWIDPESDYDMKLIRVDYVTKIKYSDKSPQGPVELEADIQRFVKNTTEISISDSSSFNIDIIRNIPDAVTGVNSWQPFTQPGRYMDQKKFTLDNWNYRAGVIGEYSITPDVNLSFPRTIVRVWKESPPISWQANHTWTDSNGYTFRIYKQSDEKYRIEKYTTSTDYKGNVTYTYYDLNMNYMERDGSDAGSSFFTITGLKIGNKIRIPKDGKFIWVYVDSNQVVNGWEYFLLDSKSSIAEVNFLANDFQKIELILSSNEIGKVSVDYLSPGNLIFSNKPIGLINRIVSELPPNQIRIKEDGNPFGKLLDPNKITNSHLAEDNPLSIRYTNADGFIFQVPVFGNSYGSSSKFQKSKIKQLYRYMKSEYDTETYYLIEGILPSINKGRNSVSQQLGEGDSGDYYNMPEFLGAIKVFVSLLTDIFSKLIPQINTTISLIKNPSSFITEIIKEKLGNNMKMFSPEFFNDYQQMIALPPLERKEFVKSKPSIKEYVYVNDLGDYRVLFDGAAMKTLTLFGKSIPEVSIKFGMEVNHKKPVPIRLIFKIDLKGITDNSLRSILDGTSKNQNLGGVKVSFPSSNGLNSNSGSVDQLINGESVSVVYSTGKFIKGVNYEYIYVTEYVAALIKEADDLSNSEDVADLNQAMSKYNEALDKDPNNTLIKDRLESLMSKIPNSTQAILEFLLSIVTAPLKLITDVIDKILSFFTNLNFATLPADIVEFISFQWVLAIFSPATILKVFGIEILPIPIPDLTGKWIPAAAKFALFKSGAVPGIPVPKPQFDNYPTKNGDIDMNKLFSFAWAPFIKNPTIPKTSIPVGLSSMTKDQVLVHFKKSPLIAYDRFNLKVGAPPINELISSLICLIEAIINAIIDLFWAILGLEVLIPPDKVHIKLCKKFKDTSNLSPAEIGSLLNNGSGDVPGDFIYEVKTSDGKDLKDLNKEELQIWLSENSDYQYEFTFNDPTIK